MTSRLIPFQRHRFTVAHLVATVTPDTLYIVNYRLIIDNRDRFYRASLHAFKTRYTKVFMDDRPQSVLEGQRDRLCKRAGRVAEVARTCIGDRPLKVLND
jgi:hypothetical protein